MENIGSDLIYLAVLLFGMFAHYMKGRVKGENQAAGNELQTVINYFSDRFWKTTFPAIMAGVAFIYGSIQGAPEFFYPVTKMALVWALMSGYTTDSLLNGQIDTNVKKP